MVVSTEYVDELAPVYAGTSTDDLATNLVSHKYTDRYLNGWYNKKMQMICQSVMLSNVLTLTSREMAEVFHYWHVLWIWVT